MLPRMRRRLVLLLCALLLLGAGGTIWWRDGGKRLFFPRKWDEVEPGLYRSGQIHRRLIEDVLREHRIDLVVDLARDEEGDLDNAAEREATARLGIPVLSLALGGDGSGDPQDYVRALTTAVEAHRQGRHVLVHCEAGSERTGAFFLLYRTLFQGWTPEAAIAEYASFRNRPLGEGSSMRYLDLHLPEIASGLVASGALDALPHALPSFAPAVAAAGP
jgi:protein-tyrosine phosphatase